MNSSELLRRRQEASIQWKSYWKPRDASEVTVRSGYIANNTVVRSNYHPTLPSAGSTQEGATSGNPGRCVVNVETSPVNGFPTNYSYDTVLNACAGNTVCRDTTWNQTENGMSLKTCSEIQTIIYGTSSSNVDGYLLKNNSRANLCIPMLAPQTPHYVEAKCLGRYTIQSNV